MPSHLFFPVGQPSQELADSLLHRCPAVPRQPYLPSISFAGSPPWPGSLLGCISPLAGDVKFEDDGLVGCLVNGRSSGHGVGECSLRQAVDDGGPATGVLVRFGTLGQLLGDGLRPEDYR